VLQENFSEGYVSQVSQSERLVASIADFEAETKGKENDKQREKEEEKLYSPYILIGKELSYSLHYGENSIGRAKTNHIVIDNGYVSRNHCVVIVHTDNRVEIFESSKNGTYVNKQEIVHSLLSIGDEIVIAPRSCNYKLVLSEKESVNENYQNNNSTSFDNMDKSSRSSSSRSSRSSSSSSSKFQPTKPLKSYTKEHNISGFSLIELLIVIVVLGVIASISVLNVVSSRRAANSASAVQSMRVISSSQSSYSAGVGNGEYATADSLLKQQYIDDSLAAASLPTPSTIRQQPKSGYVFVFNTIANNPTTNTIADYEISARPLLGNGFARAGDKSFFLDSTGVIRFSPSALAPFADSNSQPLN